ncbi:MAG: LytTR family transcriptional regulator [Sphingobacteriales bacterium]|nr:MAG: LytTR family transcriptional regulator [Sphingobacteriales bacterium]
MNHMTTAAIAIEKKYPALKIVKPAKTSAWQKLAIPTGTGMTFIPFEEILYCKALSNYTNVYTKSGKAFTCCKTLKEIEGKLSAQMFIRIHRAYLISLDSITSLNKQTAELELQHSILVPVARNKKAGIYKTLHL